MVRVRRPGTAATATFFRSYALDIELDLEAAADREQLQRAPGGHVCERAELLGAYART